ncbi:MAG: metalloregulator ArsR/SmtB family transcription factor [Chitinophagales bacterium]
MPAQQSIKLVHSPDGEIRLDNNSLRKTVLIIRSVNHKLRLQIIRLLDEHPQLSVTDIHQKLKIEQSIASQHLAILRRSGVVITRRNGKFIYYTLNNERLDDIAACIKEMAT